MEKKCLGFLSWFGNINSAAHIWLSGQSGQEGCGIRLVWIIVIIIICKNMKQSCLHYQHSHQISWVAREISPERCILTLWLRFLSYTETGNYRKLTMFIFVVLFLCLHREDARVSGRSLGGSRRATPGGGGVGSAQPECWEPPGALSQRYVNECKDVSLKNHKNTLNIGFSLILPTPHKNIPSVFYILVVSSVLLLTVQCCVSCFVHLWLPLKLQKDKAAKFQVSL